jgi:malate dehydrogenase (oxaloacetate-decarboxylating)(NADP+)
MVRSMARFPVVFALATPEPEIAWEAARGARRDVIVATSLPEHPNAVLDLLSCPFLFRGALDVQATRITEGMLLAAARALAALAREDVVEDVERAYGREHFSFGPEYLLPKAIDPRILVRESAAVAQQAIAEGVARRPLEAEAHQESLAVRMGTGRETLRALMLRARQQPMRVVFPDGTSETILRACGMLLEEGIARPILLGDRDEVRARCDALGLDLGGITVVDPAHGARLDAYVEEYFHMRRRHGVIGASAARRLLQPEYYAAMMLHAGDADMMVAGLAAHYAESLRVVLEVIGPAPGFRRVSSHYVVLLPRDVVFLADCAVNIDPDAEGLAETALLAARQCRSLGFEPRVAMLSFSSFGSVDHPASRKVREATEIARRRAPELMIDGEMQLGAARAGALRQEYFPFCRLEGDANVLVFPDLQSGNMAMQALQNMAEAVPIGPVLMGTRLPVHLLQYGESVEEVVNLTTVGAVEAAARQAGPGA